MKVEPLSTVRTSKPRRGAREASSGSGSFAEVLADKAATPSNVTAGASLGAIDSLLALQEVPDATARRREARKRGETLLDQLDEIRLGLLTGRLSRAQIERLASLVANRSGPLGAPELEAVLAEIELRAAVELAKFERRDRQSRG